MRKWMKLVEGDQPVTESDPLVEKLLKVAPWEWTTQEESHANARFECGPSHFEVSFSGIDAVSVTFWNDTTDGDGIGVVGGQDARGVFATMTAIITDFVTKNNPAKIFWTARPKEYSRQRLYDRLCQTLILPGYRFEHGRTRLVYRFVRENGSGHGESNPT
jgi:hypothetical protein